LQTISQHLFFITRQKTD